MQRQGIGRDKRDRGGACEAAQRWTRSLFGRPWRVPSAAVDACTGAAVFERSGRCVCMGCGVVLSAVLHVGVEGGGVVHAKRPRVGRGKGSERGAAGWERRGAVCAQDELSQGPEGR